MQFLDFQASNSVSPASLGPRRSKKKCEHLSVLLSHIQKMFSIRVHMEDVSWICLKSCSKGYHVVPYIICNTSQPVCSSQYALQMFSSAYYVLFWSLQTANKFSCKLPANLASFYRKELILERRRKHSCFIRII